MTAPPSRCEKALPIKHLSIKAELILCLNFYIFLAPRHATEQQSTESRQILKLIEHLAADQPDSTDIPDRIVRQLKNLVKCKRDPLSGIRGESDSFMFFFDDGLDQGHLPKKNPVGR